MDWSSLRDELDRWDGQGLQATFWWRDDDATDISAAMEHLLGLVGSTGMPLTLAVIPADACSRLAERCENISQVRAVQHGFSHLNHAARGGKKVELAPGRPWVEVAAQLKDGQHRLRSLFDLRALPVLVPPWNRIPPQFVGELPALGYRGLSTFGPRLRATPFSGLRQANTHVDPIEWHGSRGFVGERVALESAVGHLRARRFDSVDRSEPTGLLTHHLQHDEATWRFCERFLMETARHPGGQWLSASEVFGLA